MNRKKIIIIMIMLVIFAVCSIGAHLIKKTSSNHEQKPKNDTEYDIISNGETTIIKEDYTLFTDGNDEAKVEYNNITDNDTEFNQDVYFEKPNFGDESWREYNTITNDNTTLIKEVYITSTP